MEEQDSRTKIIKAGAVIGVPIASLLAWGGERLLSLDESLVQLTETVRAAQELQARHSEQVTSLTERDAAVAIKIAENAKELENRGERFERALRDLVGMDEKLTKATTSLDEWRALVQAIDARQIDLLQRVSKTETAIEYLRMPLLRVFDTKETK